MIYKCKWGEVPPIPDVNAHNVVLHGPLSTNVPDYRVYVDAESGKEWARSQILDRITRLATALVADPNEGGLGLKPGREEVIGVFTKSRVVGPKSRRRCKTLLLTSFQRVGL